jgi:hypothetical protein
VSSRSDDLTADLLQDLTAEQAAPVATPAHASATETERPDAFVETSLYLAPHTWKRPGIGRDATAIAFRAGPVQIRIGRRR